MKKLFLAILILSFTLLGISCKCYEHSVIPPVEIVDAGESIDDMLPDNDNDLIIVPPDISTLIEYNVTVIYPNTGSCGGTVVESIPEATLVLTAAHCVLNKEAKTMKYGFIEFNDNGRYRVEVQAINRQQDLALLVVTDPIETKEAASLSLINPQTGDHVWVIGNGAGIEDLMSDGIIGKADVMHIYFKKQHCMIIDASAAFGNSGGGVFNDDNELIGVLSTNGPQHPVDGEWNYAIHLDEIKKFLRKYL